MYNKKLRTLTIYFIQILQSFTQIKYHLYTPSFSGIGCFCTKICEYSKYADNSAITTQYVMLLLLYLNTPKTGISQGIFSV
jgi:hypothetical protein